MTEKSREHIRQLREHTTTALERFAGPAYLDIAGRTAGKPDFVDQIEAMYRTWAGVRSFPCERCHDDTTTPHVTLHIAGRSTYRRLRSETGLHRLARKVESGTASEEDAVLVRVWPDVEGLGVRGWDALQTQAEEIRHFDRRGVG
jgi:protein subunit release factor A